MTKKRFINDIDIGQLIDTKGELSTINYSDAVDFYELWEFLNKLNDENEQLKSDNFNLNKSVECLDEIIKEQCNKIAWADECGVRWDEEYNEWIR